jgi:hypothetical protein
MQTMSEIVVSNTRGAAIGGNVAGEGGLRTRLTFDATVQ